MLNSQIKLNKFSTIFYESNNKDFLIKKGSCYHIVPFLMKLSGIENDNLSKGVSKSIIALDTLARKIDFKIDNISINPFSDSNNLSIEKVKSISSTTAIVVQNKPMFLLIHSYNFPFASTGVSSEMLSGVRHLP